jgi:PAS domain S-box-containing protein
MEKKKAPSKHLMEESHYILAAIVQSTDDAIVGKDLNGNITAWNTGAEGMYGYSSAEALGKSGAIIIPPDRAFELPMMLEVGRNGQVIRNFETVRVAKDGSTIDVSITISPIIGRDGEIIGTSTTARDITQLKEAQDQLRQSERHFRNLLEASLDPMVTINSDGRITGVNLATVEATGIPRDKLIGTEFPAYFTEPDKAERVYQLVFRQDLIQNYPLAMQHVSGKVIDVLYNASVYRDPNGKVLGVFAAARDITKLKKTQDALEQNVQDLRRRTSQLEATNKELEAFAYSVSHDLRTPLRAVDGFSQALEEDYADVLGDAGKRFVSRIRAGVNRMSDLIEDLLQLSRLTRAGMKLQLVDLSALATEAIHELRETYSDRQVDVTIEPGLQARGDPRLLKQLLMNLLGNSWKFTSKKPEAKIEFSTIDIDKEQVYYIRDNGVGFDMTYSGKLFGAFQRLHTSDEFEGTGIGLATAQRIVHRHGGRIWAEGEIDKGACIFFTLNLNEEDMQ